MKKNTYRAMAIVITCIMLCGCGKDCSNNKELTEYQMTKKMIEETTELNDRQKEIMKKEGLSVNFDQLKPRQQEAAIKIEMLMSYLEDKYDKEFVYEGYNDDYYGSLSARALDDNKCRNIQASLDYVDGEYTYSDTYGEVVLAANDYEDLFDDFMRENYPEPDYFLEVYVAEMDGDKITTDNASVHLTIVLKSCFDKKEEYEEFLNAVAEWMQNDKYGEAIYCQVMDEEDFKEANYYNYNRLRKEGMYKYIYDVDIEPHQSIVIEERE